MALREYRRKRNFQRTPEPRGKAAAKGGRSFVVQKHAARRLHYDFRLELDGVLKSWAVPKGPSLDPADKALAVHVEDHPLEYGSFEGVIPEGEYGGGTVMLWDRGTWEPAGDPAAGLRRGKLSFVLHGEKLRGLWSLVQMRGESSDGGRNWLLIKAEDDYARPGAAARALKDDDRSVASGRSMAEIARDADRVWSSRKSQPKPEVQLDPAGLPGARPAPLPRTFKPQLPTLVREAPRGDRWLHEIKFDGYRILCRIDHGQATLLTRRGQDWTRRFSIIAEAAARLPVETAILDGEVVVLADDGTTDFQALQNALKGGRRANFIYYVFDLPYLNGCDLTRVPLEARKQQLKLVLDAAGENLDARLRYSDHIRGHGEDVVHHACRQVLEGIVSKRADSPYEPRRSRTWVKLKCLNRQEFVIGGYTDPSGSRKHFGALLLGYHDTQGRLVYCGRVGTGFTDKSLAQVMKELKRRTTDTPPFHNPPAGREARGVHWLKPELVAEVEFAAWTDDGILRHPSFKGLREDKRARDITLERPVEAGSPSRRQRRQRMPNVARKTAAPPNENSVAGVPLSNPGRVLYPEQGLTKLDIGRYYESAAEWILPHVVDRPLTLVRCPRGRSHKCFFQKHLNQGVPEAVRTVPIREKEGKADYLVIDDLPGLIALVQLGVLEIHLWGCRADQIERPDRLVFDLDPGEGVGWEGVVDAALVLRERLENLTLKSFVRTTGGKGLHVVVPISRRTTWDDARQFAQDVAAERVRSEPGKYVATLTKSRRTGKIFVDYLRNGRGATAVASYSTRARAGAPVATPLAWDELSTKTTPDQFTVATVPRRLASLKADPWEGLSAVRQTLTKAMRAAVRG
ncbi:MAG TPA: DNA ligase D [Planctomycetaceae bacterium]|nr:DNA ligase D [Planctomycetaceae bacterium]